MTPFTISRLRVVASALALAGSGLLSGAAIGQTVDDEVRCVIVSNGFAQGAKDPRGRQVAASTGAYFIGRLDARSPAQIGAAIAAQRKLVTPQNAGPMMNACAVRAGRAEARLRSLAK